MYRLHSAPAISRRGIGPERRLEEKGLRGGWKRRGQRIAHSPSMSLMAFSTGFIDWGTAGGEG
jgi:hypothetical protein